MEAIFLKQISNTNERPEMARFSGHAVEVYSETHGLESPRRKGRKAHGLPSCSVAPSEQAG